MLVTLSHTLQTAHAGPRHADAQTHFQSLFFQLAPPVNTGKQVATGAKRKAETAKGRRMVCAYPIYFVCVNMWKRFTATWQQPSSLFEVLPPKCAFRQKPSI
jgi:hypothetical protein